MPQTKQDVTEIQWDLAWMEMTNLLDKPCPGSWAVLKLFTYYYTNDNTTVHNVFMDKVTYTENL